MKQHGSLDTRLGPSNIGFTVLSPKVLPGCGRVSGRGAHLACLPRIYRGYETKYSAHPGNRDTTKTSGMGLTSDVNSGHETFHAANSPA